MQRETKIKAFIKLIYLIALVFSNYAYAQVQPIRIAVIGPFTGAYAGYGTQILSGASQAVNDINKAGTLNGINLELVPLDDQCNPDYALKQVEKLIKQKNIQAVIGPMCSACALATNKLFAQANILVINPSATNQELTRKNIATVFRMIGNDQQQAQITAEFLVKKLNAKKIAILHDREVYSKNLADLVSENLLHLGKAPVLYQAIPRGTKNFTSLVKKLKLLQVDAIYFPALYPEVGSLSLSLNALQLQIPLVSADAIAINSFSLVAGGPKIAKSVIFSFATDPKKLISSKKTIDNMQKNGLETNGFALYSYAAIEVVAKAIESTNNLDNKILANWLHHNEVNTVLGKKSWDTNGDIIDGNFEVYTWDYNDYNSLS